MPWYGYALAAIYGTAGPLLALLLWPVAPPPQQARQVIVVASIPADDGPACELVAPAEADLDPSEVEAEPQPLVVTTDFEIDDRAESIDSAELETTQGDPDSISTFDGVAGCPALMGVGGSRDSGVRYGCFGSTAAPGCATTRRTYFGSSGRPHSGADPAVTGWWVEGLAAAEAAIAAEDYGKLVDNPFRDPRQSDFQWSTFSIDVDTASYANVRRMLNQGHLPPADAVRIEEMINYFDYEYAPPHGEHPFAVHTEIATCPWNPQHRLAKIGLKGKVVERAERPASNLVFLLDVSGSMNQENKLPLVQQAIRLLVTQLDQRDTVAMVVYAGAAGMVLKPTNGANQKAILGALDGLRAGGSTAGGAGLMLAYNTAMENFIPGGANRVILCTDGDFNVGVTGEALVEHVVEWAKSNVYLSVFGFGMGNLKDGFMEKLTNKGNGTYGYIDTLNEAKKAFVEQLSGTLVTIAKDVKIQVVFNAEHVGAYRLIGYANRMLKKEDFANDKVDAGDVGAGHMVTALYELVPPGREGLVLPEAGQAKREEKWETPSEGEESVASEDVFTLKLRYKAPEGDVSRLLVEPVMEEYRPLARASADFKFAAAVAMFGLLLRDTPHKEDASYDLVRRLATEGKGADRYGYRTEFLGLVQKAAAVGKAPATKQEP